jgi:hypothetical protein
MAVSQEAAAGQHLLYLPLLVMRMLPLLLLPLLLLPLLLLLQAWLTLSHWVMLGWPLPSSAAWSSRSHQQRPTGASCSPTPYSRHSAGVFVCVCVCVCVCVYVCVCMCVCFGKGVSCPVTGRK